MIDFKALVTAGVHFGHQSSRWCPKMAPYIWGKKNDIHLIDVSKTAILMEQAAQFLESVAAEGKSILWVGTKKPAQEIMGSIAQRLNMPYVTHRWIGGTVSNFPQVKKSVTKLLHHEDIVAKSETTRYTKKEISVFGKIVARLRQNVGGIQNLTMPLGAIVLVDVRKEHSALREAEAMGVPVVALVDTNGDPSAVDYVIPGNDDVPRAIKIVMEYLGEAAERGSKRAVAKAAQDREDAALAKAAKKAAGGSDVEAALEAVVDTDDARPKHAAKKPFSHKPREGGAGRRPDNRSAQGPKKRD
jgi:small subunit ribosomal protein S2